jgi:hypothetical protein
MARRNVASTTIDKWALAGLGVLITLSIADLVVSTIIARQLANQPTASKNPALPSGTPQPATSRS